MAKDFKSRDSYPCIPAKNWWLLRQRFRQALPRQVDVSYLRSLFELGNGPAKFLLRNLQIVELINGSYQVTDLGTRWRDDEQYEKVCQEIREEIYPSGLLDVLPPPNPEREKVERWFRQELHIGQSAANKMAAFYLLVSDAKVGASEQTSKSRGSRPPVARARVAPSPSVQAPSRVESPSTGQVKAATSPTTHIIGEQPNIHIDVNIHIDSTASSEQIDQIFTSLARHFYGREV